MAQKHGLRAIRQKFATSRRAGIAARDIHAAEVAKMPKKIPGATTAAERVDALLELDFKVGDPLRFPVGKGGTDRRIRELDVKAGFIYLEAFEHPVSPMPYLKLLREAQAK